MTVLRGRCEPDRRMKTIKKGRLLPMAIILSSIPSRRVIFPFIENITSADYIFSCCR